MALEALALLIPIPITKLASRLLSQADGTEQKISGVEGIMKKMVKLVAVVAVLVSLTLGQSVLMAAPVQGAARATANSSHVGIYQHFLSLLAAVWGTDSATHKITPQSKCAV